MWTDRGGVYMNIALTIAVWCSFGGASIIPNQKICRKEIHNCVNLKASQSTLGDKQEYLNECITERVNKDHYVPKTTR